MKHFNETINSNPDNEVTFDFEGDPVLRETVKEANVKLSSMRAGMGTVNKKLKEGYSKINAETSRIEVNRKEKDKQDNFRNINRQS